MRHGALLTWTERIERSSVAFRLAVIAISLAVVVLLDHASGPELTLTFPYALCTMAAAWFVSRESALAVAGVAAVASLVVRLLGERDEGWAVLLLNTALGGFSLALFAVLTSAVRRSVADLVDTARLDEMTGILSRRGLLHELREARRRAQRRSAPLGVLYLDLDGLKEVNDRDGHAAGDALLGRFVDGVSQHLRSTDVFGRLGGDEFAIVLERVDPLVIDGVVARILGDPEVPDASCGVRVFDGDYPPPAEMLARADRRMYDDKRRRRSRLGRLGRR
jgi:diguanylate cyclase (GGDEF)-like protein